MLGLFCEVNAGVLATALGAVGVHSATAYWDQAYAEQWRRVTPIEQHVHSLLEVSPLMAALFLTALHWDQAQALTGMDRYRPRFAIRLKRRDPLSNAARIRLLMAVAVFGVLPTPRNYGDAGRQTPPWILFLSLPSPLPTPYVSRPRQIPGRTGRSRVLTFGLIATIARGE